MNELGKFIIEERKKQNLTQKELAKRMGVVPSVLSTLENGGTKKLMPKTLERLSKGLNLDKEYITDSIKKYEMENQIKNSLYYRANSEENIIYNPLNSVNTYRRILGLINSYTKHVEKQWRFIHLDNGSLIGTNKNKRYLKEYLVAFDLKLLHSFDEEIEANENFNHIFESILIEYLTLETSVNELLILFTVNNEKSEKAYQYFKNYKFNNMKFKITLILFSLNRNIVVETKTIKKKNR